MQIGDEVRCLNGSIDRNFGKNLIGRIEGFARFSAYHPREARISFENVPDKRSEWFWASDIELTKEDEQ